MSLYVEHEQIPSSSTLSITLVEVNLGLTSPLNLCGSSLYFFANCNLPFRFLLLMRVCILWDNIYIAVIFFEWLIEIPCDIIDWCFGGFTALTMFLSSTAVFHGRPVWFLLFITSAVSFCHLMYIVWLNCLQCIAKERNWPCCSNTFGGALCVFVYVRACMHAFGSVRVFQNVFFKKNYS